MTRAHRCKTAMRFCRVPAGVLDALASHVERRIRSIELSFENPGMCVRLTTTDYYILTTTY